MDEIIELCCFDDQINEECRLGCVDDIKAHSEDWAIKVIEGRQEDLHVAVESDTCYCVAPLFPKNESSKSHNKLYLN